MSLLNNCHFCLFSVVFIKSLFKTITCKLLLVSCFCLFCVTCCHGSTRQKATEKTLSCHGLSCLKPAPLLGFGGLKTKVTEKTVEKGLPRKVSSGRAF